MCSKPSNVGKSLGRYQKMTLCQKIGLEAETLKYKDIWISGLVRFLTLGVSSTASIFAMRILFQNGGISSYSFSALLISLAMITPFLSFGIGATVTNFVAASTDFTKDLVRAQSFLTSMRTLIVTGTFLIVIAICGYFLGFWENLFGDSIMFDQHINGSITFALIMIGIALPFSLGHSVLVGLKKNSLSTLIVGSAGPVSLFWVFICARNNLPAAYIALGPNVGVFLSVIMAWVLVRKLNFLPFDSLWVQVFKLGQYQGRSIRGSSLPMGFILIGLSLTLQLDKIILSHTSNLNELAKYALTAQMLSPTLSLMGVLTTSFWPYLTSMRSLGNATFGVLLRGLMSVVVGTSLLVGITAVFSSVIIGFISNSSFKIDKALFFLFGLVILVQIFHSTVSYSLTQESDLVFQAKLILLMCPVNIILSWNLSSKYGAAGPLVATLMTLPTLVIIPNLFRAKSRLRNIENY